MKYTLQFIGENAQEMEYEWNKEKKGGLQGKREINSKKNHNP